MSKEKTQQCGAQGKHAAANEKMLKDQQVMNANGLESVVKVTFWKYFDYPVEFQNELFDLFLPVTVVRHPTDSRSGLVCYLATVKEEKMFELFQRTDDFIEEFFRDQAECVFIHLMKE